MSNGESGQPLPRQAAPQLRDRRLAHAVVSGKNFLRALVDPDRSYVVFREFGEWMCRTVAHSILAVTVKHVFELAAEEEMIRPTAGRNIAAVKDVIGILKRTVCQGPRHAVGVDVPALGFGLRDGETTVAFVVQSSGPEPAAVRLPNFLPEPIFDAFHSFSGHITFVVA